MSSDGKENIRHVTCTNHAARSDKDISRICPSKQSRRELEDIYFSLQENNTQLKKTVNGQLEHIKLLTTKVHRMTVQKNAFVSQNKECCTRAKAFLSEQKETIENLKKTNERLSDRIRILNMRLCSAKQFLKRSSTPSAVRCIKLTPNASIKLLLIKYHTLNSVLCFRNSSIIALNTKESDLNVRTEASSSHLLNKRESTTNIAAEMDSTEIKDEPCQQNKCRTTIDELKQKIVNLEEELTKTHEQYSERMCKLEEEMQELRGENYRMKALKAESEHRMETEEKKSEGLLQKLRNTEAQCVNLVTELQIEKSKVLELETQVKSADISSQVAEALEKHLITTMMAVLDNSDISRFDPGPEKEKVVNKNSDDSGYADDKQESPKAEQNILDQIASLQSQLNTLKLSMIFFSFFATRWSYIIGRYK
ncbi:centromere protein F-like [Bicyclus anynana]|uniref:Centromere protein F-like n=1 Tax=Bicyclus anynana TaxID=110368 RepID=A0ABM3LER7_BICAN|nr:centromere protein F-like [Bicyclus anynana]